MPRLSEIERDTADESLHEYYDRDVDRYGAVLNNTKVYAHNPAITRAIKELAAAFEQATTIPVALKALVRVRVATLNHCPF